MHSLSSSLVPYRVTVNAVAPALIADTGMIPGDQKSRHDLVPLVPAGRLGKPGDVVEAIMMLIANSYITNQTLLIDGGTYPH
jgi:3-oxoacyl-[acyl-carrier protein] reductase